MQFSSVRRRHIQWADPVIIIINLEDKNLDPASSLPLTTPFVEQKNAVDRSTLYSFKAPFEVLQADIADI